MSRLRTTYFGEMALEWKLLILQPVETDFGEMGNSRLLSHWYAHGFER